MLCSTQICQMNSNELDWFVETWNFDYSSLFKIQNSFIVNYLFELALDEEAAIQPIQTNRNTWHRSWIYEKVVSKRIVLILKGVMVIKKRKICQIKFPIMSIRLLNYILWRETKIIHFLTHTDWTETIKSFQLFLMIDHLHRMVSGWLYVGKWQIVGTTWWIGATC